jgi:hypothetical protein
MWYEVFLLLLQAGGRASSEAPLPSHLAELNSMRRECGVFSEIVAKVDSVRCGPCVGFGGKVHCAGAKGVNG